ncbi:SAM-dependent methyltransferase [Winogradskya humida]|uniref:Cyclopropane-fatty-acyl-phospholipid synthase n=1 Tax=Winogradskya humida TaxID=113566 RepID=A0ABQ3ZU43_9ACTN|nr:cyclopropane-fatty-acyl-phospholipid synthase family protein [Actinoplanes humidus]GIE22074.1 cyclopropane-fatty-acyl-phospholipid synthase [Actinoplanes humidus]
MTTVLEPVEVAAQRWPDVAVTPRAPLRARIAARMFRRISGRLALRVAYPDGRVTGATGPTLRLVRPQAFYARLGTNGLIGFGEAYQAGDWEADDPVAVLTVFAERMGTLIPPRLQWLRHLHGTRAPRAERNTREGARSNIHRHYDLSNALFALFLDPSMSYSSALFDTSADLTTAQHRKIDRLLDATGVGPGSKVLEIGTGWGELAIRAAQRGASVLSVTLSAEQRTLALRRAADAGVLDRVDVRLCDYREIEPAAGGYDAILSVEMIEAVGEAYWQTYASALARHLAPGGTVGLQMITMSHERLLETRSTYTWIHKYVFPGGLVPSVPAIEAVLAGAGLQVRDRLDFGADYATTLRHWRSAFLDRRGEVAALGFDDTFVRTWNFYLAYCEAGFAAGYIDVAQLVIGHPS